MIYPFQCDRCGNYEEAYRPVKEAGADEVCSSCGHIMRRVFTAPQVRIVNMEGYNVGLGCRQRDVKDKLRRIEAEEGRELVEVGNERIKHRQGHSDYELTAKDHAELNRIMD